MISPRPATAIGAVAILLWAGLATLSVGVTAWGSLQLMTAGFAVAFVAGAIWLIITGRAAMLDIRRLPHAFVAEAVLSLGGYHLLYFQALRTAPTAEANLVNYLWPLLIAVLADRTRILHTLPGALIGFTGVALLLYQPGGFERPSWGHAAALAAAIVWTRYSIRNARFAAIPSEALIGIFGLVALIGAAVMAASGTPLPWPGTGQALLVLAIGIGPFGLAFLAWDLGTKHGHVGMLGVLAFSAPVLSTCLLILTGHAAMSGRLALSCTLVVAGAVLATMAGRRRATHSQS